ncbi:hypothetical protein H4Q26_016597 [Puccinia striiformis f. sp. tritici PST-130]|nr:hypothetical protein Pst134EB_028513 [Puccinia striiformis f. sp. tritici]KAI9624823.1 hypothetical protein H4Q26_016597 [Puccinia striiformis f. sp. tritici PST-130]
MMSDLQSWPIGTKVSLQTFGSGRLRFVTGEDHTLGSRLQFEFARGLDDVVIHQVLPPVQFYGPPIRPAVVPATPQLYQVVQSNNRYLRSQYPEIDLPKALLLESIVEDQQLPAQDVPLLSPIITGLTINEKHDLIISVGGPVSNELYCTFLEDGLSDLPKLRTTSKPAATLRTPVQQLASGPSLNQAGNAVFLARTHDATTMFAYSCSHNSVRTSRSAASTSSSPPFSFKKIYQLKTSDTNHERHVDSCVGHTINDTLRQLIVLNSKGQLWKVSGIDGTAMPDVKRVGLVKYSEPKEITWARCGIYPTNDCLVVGLRNSLCMIDPRVYGECSTLYGVLEDQLITDVQRYINHQTPHLRLINTTSSMICVDDRKPGIPMLLVKHFRSPDLTLSMGFPAEPEWSPDPNYDPSTAGERFDQVLLWSRTNDVASLHQFRSHPDIPPAVLGYPSAVPVTCSHPLNPRAGLVFFRRKVANSHPEEKICLIEMQRDGSLWHRQIGLFDPSVESYPVNPDLIDRVNLHSSDVESSEESVKKLDSDSEDGFTRIPNSSLKLETLSQDFTDACLSEPPTIDGEETHVPCIDSMDPLGFCVLPRPYEQSIAANQAISNDDRSDMMIDLTPVLRSFLPEIINFSSEDAIVVDDDEAEADSGQQVAEIVGTAINLARKTRALNDPSGQADERSDCGTVVDEPSGSLATNRLMEEWKPKALTSEYQWTDICAATNDDVTGVSGAESDHSAQAGRSRSQSRLSGIEEEELRKSRENTVDMVQLVSKAKNQIASEIEITTIPKHHPRKFINAAFASSSLPSSIQIGSTSQPDPSVPNSSSPPAASIPTQAASQLIPGPHAARSSSTSIHPRKKKRVGGF